MESELTRLVVQLERVILFNVFCVYPLEDKTFFIVNPDVPLNKPIYALTHSAHVEYCTLLLFFEGVRSS